LAQPVGSFQEFVRMHLQGGAPFEEGSDLAQELLDRSCHDRDLGLYAVRRPPRWSSKPRVNTAMMLIQKAAEFGHVPFSGSQRAEVG
jgi:hypothetical protein